tara:strand:- start:4602 stop:5135 length:534 start_codon:yes stop_codon:yes gene_type:complete
MAFWSEQNLDPKRQFRWVLTFSNLGVSEYVAKTVNKPTWTIAHEDHKFINHTFKFPGRVTWNDVNCTFADPGGNDDVTSVLYRLLLRSGYNNPLNSDTAKDSVTKGEAVTSLGEVTIQQLGASGDHILETWRLENAWASEVKFGDLSYEQEGLTELSMVIKYDWAIYEGPGNVVTGG